MKTTCVRWAPRVKDVTFNFLPVNTNLSLDKKEVRRRTLGLYRAWYRQIPIIFYDYNFPVTPEQGRSKLREIFVKNSRIVDPRLINTLVIKGQMELNETVNKQKEECHLWKYFRAEEKKPQTFLTKFLEGR